MMVEAGSGHVRARARALELVLDARDEAEAARTAALERDAEDVARRAGTRRRPRPAGRPVADTTGSPYPGDADADA